MLVETRVARSKSGLLKELQGLPVTKAVNCRNVDKKVGDAISRAHHGVTVIIMFPQIAHSMIETLFTKHISRHT